MDYFWQCEDPGSEEIKRTSFIAEILIYDRLQAKTQRLKAGSIGKFMNQMQTIRLI